MFVEIENSNQRIKVDLYPTVEYEAGATFHDFPEMEFNADTGPIYHTIKVTSSLEMILEECKGDETLEKQISERYWIDKEEDKIIMAKMVITEFPNDWKERIDESWAYWLDALDGDHAVIGNRADEILERDLYDDPFDCGSLFYVQDLEIHPEYSSSGFTIDLLKYTFEYLIRDRNGMLFVIPQERITEEAEKDRKNKTKRLIEFYEKSGFARAFNSANEDVVMEIDLRLL
ncbi:hypothetical protein [Paenibacillus phytohabitans]|uniref:hypothetical protein n=1 Tax=Paenibacillus phytohabitans TaxID=2654978 RepID=UPI0014932318|nr:hypothetical protein [Paenibacillus phytohabitans]